MCGFGHLGCRIVGFYSLSFGVLGFRVQELCAWKGSVMSVDLRLSLEDFHRGCRAGVWVWVLVQFSYFNLSLLKKDSLFGGTEKASATADLLDFDWTVRVETGTCPVLVSQGLSVYASTEQATGCLNAEIS